MGLRVDTPGHHTGAVGVQLERFGIALQCLVNALLVVLASVVNLVSISQSSKIHRMTNCK